MDFLMRLLNLEGRARQLTSELSPSAREKLDAYTRGVNSGLLEISETAPEFQRWGYRPDPWKPEHSLAVLLLQSFDQTRKSFEVDFRENTRAQNFPTVPDWVWREAGSPWDVSVLKPGEFPGSAGKAALHSPETPKQKENALFSQSTPAPDFDRDLGPWRSPPGLGSNNWALAPSRSESGKAWFANDPHLGLKHPPFWFWIHLEAPDLDVAGASLPGVPLIPSGVNRHAAWGLTNSYLDTARVFLVDEREVPGLKQERPTIQFRLWKFRLPFFFKTFRRTAQGWPILPLDAPKGKVWVLRWTGFDLSGSEISSFFDVFQAKSAAELDASLSRVGVPAFNFVFADTKGNIGYRAVGKVAYAEKAWPARIAESSWNEVLDWKTLDASEAPSLMNPSRGWIATANHRHWPEGAYRHGGFSYAEGFRGSRIEELLLAKPRHGQESLRKIQCDVQAVDARWFKPELLGKARAAYQEAGIAPLASEERVLKTLEAWDGQTARDCTACAPYRRWMEKLLEVAQWKEAALLRALRGDPAAASLGITSKLVLEKFQEALKDLAQKDPGISDPSKPLRSWGEWHRAPFAHMSELSDFSWSPLATPGDEHSVNPGTSRWTGQGWSHHQGASQRLIVEMTDPPTVHLTLAGPQEGAPDAEPAKEDGPWNRDWVGCHPEKVQFPLDWSQIPEAR